MGFFLSFSVSLLFCDMQENICHRASSIAFVPNKTNASGWYNRKLYDKISTDWEKSQQMQAEKRENFFLFNTEI